MKEYYDTRAPEYDEWYLGVGRFAERDRPGWEAELEQLFATIAALPGGRTLDVACGTGFLTRHLAGDVVGLDQSIRMLDVARRQVPRATFVNGDAFALPFPNDCFSRVFMASVCGSSAVKAIDFPSGDHAKPVTPSSALVSFSASPPAMSMR